MLLCTLPSSFLQQWVAQNTELVYLCPVFMPLTSLVCGLDICMIGNQLFHHVFNPKPGGEDQWG